MAQSTGKTGRGVTFELKDTGSPSAWVAIANPTSINVGGRDAEEIDFTTLVSTGGFREFRQGFKDAGTISIEYHFSPDEASHVDLLDRWDSGEVFDWRINFEGAGWDWHLQGQGYCQNPGDLAININDPIGGTATVRVTGAPSFVAV